MCIIEIAALENGAHRNQSSENITIVPDGWAYCPNGTDYENFPFGIFSVERIDGVPTVVGWSAIGINAEAKNDTPTALERLEAQVLYTALMTDTLIEGE